MSQSGVLAGVFVDENLIGLGTAFLDHHFQNKTPFGIFFCKAADSTVACERLVGRFEKEVAAAGGAEAKCGSLFLL